MNRIVPAIALLIAILFLIPAANAAPCVADSRPGVMITDLATLEPGHDTVGNNLDRYAVIFHDIAFTQSVPGEPDHPCDTPALRNAFTTRLRGQNKLFKITDTLSKRGFFGFLHGGSASFAYATGAMLLARGELTPEMDNLLLNMEYDPSITDFCGHVGLRNPTEYNWQYGDDCVDDFTVAAEGYGWREAFFKLSGRARERDQAISFINQSLFDANRSLCLSNPDDATHPFTQEIGPCNSTLAQLRDSMANFQEDHGTAVIPLNHGMEDANYGIGLVSTLANAYLALDIAGEAVGSQPNDYRGAAGFAAGPADAQAVYEGLWRQGQRSAGTSPSAEAADPNNSDQVLAANLLAWATDKCYRPQPNQLLMFSDLHRDQPCWDQGNPFYRISTYPVAKFYEKYVGGFKGDPNKFQFRAADFPLGKFLSGDTFINPLGFFGVARYEIYYTLTTTWLEQPQIPASLFAARPPQDCSAFPVPAAQLNTSDLTVNIDELGSIPVTLTGPGPWDIEWSDGHTDSDIVTSPFIRKVSPVETTYTITKVTGGGCNGTASGSTTIHVIHQFIQVDEKFVTSGVQAQYRATLRTFPGFQPVAGVTLDFTVLGIPIGSAVTDANGVATLLYALKAPAGSTPGGIVVTAHDNPNIKPATANLTVNCGDGAYTVLPDSLNVTSQGVTNFTFQMRTTCDFTAAPAPGSETFVHVTNVDPTRGTFTVTVDSTDSARSGAVIVGGVKRIPINQGGADCNFDFSPSLSILPAESTTYQDPNTFQFLHVLTPISISAPPGCQWTLDPPSESWLHIDSVSPANRTGPGTVNVWADTNFGAARTATIAVHDGVTAAGKQAKALVNQSAPPPCTPASIDADAWGGGDITSVNQDVIVGVGASGTNLVYDWTITHPDGSGERFLAGNQIIIRSWDSRFPPPGQTYSYQVRVRNDCTGDQNSRVVQYHNAISPAGSCDAPFIYGHPGRVNSPRANALVFLGVDARDCSEVIITCSSGPADLTYQWFVGSTGNHSPIFNATQPGLFINPSVTSYYWCEVTRHCVDANGNPIELKSQSGTGMVVVPPVFKRRAVSHDFTNDGQNDLVWHNPTTGQTELWQMFGTNHYATIPMSTNNADLQTIGDFDGDGKPDLVWRNPQTGVNTVWNMQGTQFNGLGTLEPRTGADWVIGAAADLDGDDEHDLIWHNKTTGENEIWFQNGTGHTGTWALPPSPDGNWGLHGAADFNGDEKPDLFFHDRATGENSIWLMSDARVATISADGHTTTTKRFKATAQSVESLPDPSWMPAQIVDLDGDGKPDIVWRNTTTGDNMVWIMNGVTHVSTGTLEARPDTSWQIGGGGSTNSSPGPTSGTRAATALSVTATPANVNTATTITATLTANGAPLSGKTVTFSLNGQAIAQLVTDANGSATAGASVAGIASGTYPNAVTVSFNGDLNNEPSSASADLIVTGVKPVVTWSNPASIVYGTQLGAAQLNAAANVAGTFVYSPAAGAILNAGYNLLSATFTPADGSEPVIAYALIFVQKGTVAISWPSPAPIAYGTRLTSVQLNATANAPGTFTYDPPLDALLPIGTQTLQVTFTPQTLNYDAASATTTINVTQGTQTIIWGTPASIVYPQPLTLTQLSASVTTSGTAPAGALTYNPPLGTILTAGVHTLSATAAATPYYAAASATVQIVVEQPTAPVAWNNPAPIVYGTPLSATQLNASSSIGGTFTYTPAAGTILNAGNGQLLSATFTPSDPNYATTTAYATIDVRKAQQTITWAQPAPIVYGTALSATQLNANATAGALTYNPPAGTILNAGDGQTLTVTAAATPNYESAAASVTIDVKKAHPAITWATPAPIVYGTLLGAAQLNAAANVPGMFTYTPAAGTKLEAGSQTLSVLFTPTDTRDYENATATVTLEVQRANPVITWTRPADIVYGTALGAAQLNATADVAGTFAYTPAAGTILNAGAAQTLSAHFTPNDARNYNDASASTTIDVAKANQTLSWSAPAPIVYGTPLSVGQLNAGVTVVGPAAAGALVYSPAAGTVLDTGSHALTVTAQETPNYLSATTSVMIDVNRAPLSLVVDPKSKLYGGVLPVFTGTLTGVVNNDPITPSYATTASQQSVTGTYPITATLVDPNHRLFNYNVTITPSTLTVLPAPLLISANPATKQYSDLIPQLTATFTGLVLGETPSVLAGTLSITTAATPLSAPGTYPIAIGGLTSTNYAITYVGSTLTVAPEDAGVTITSPTLVSPSTITLSATVKDADDGFPGDIRNASLTFVDRGTNAVLCTATIDLIDPADQRLGVGTCTFTRASAGTIVVGAKVGNDYTRDNAADDVTLTIVTPTTDSLTGGGTTAGGAFNFTLQYDKNDAIKGTFTFTYKQNNHTYEVTATTVDSLGIARTANGGKAAVVGVATLRDVTNTKDPVTIDSAARLIATATDDGEPSRDGLSVTLLKSTGGFWLATAWNGTTAAEQPVTSGNIQVHYGK